MPQDDFWVHRLDPAVADPGPLNGTRLAVKDLVAVAGLPIHAGSRVRADAAREPRDAAVVAALRSAGAVVVGTVALHELAFGVTGINDRVGFPAHPHDDRRIPGGSSSGSAVAVARGACDLAIGTDTGGSVRIPAALCGVVGFKPAWGRYSLDGVLPLAPTIDHVGLLARSVQVVAAAHEVLTSEAVDPVRPTRIGIDRESLAAASPRVADAVDATLRTLRDGGCALLEVPLPSRAEALEISSTILIAEAAVAYRELLASPDAELIGADVLTRLRAGAAVPDAEYQAALAERDRIIAALGEVLATVDAVAGPTVPMVAPTVAEARVDSVALTMTLVAATRLANLTGVPALSLPMPTTGLPIGLQLMAANDARLLGLALNVTARD